VTGSPFHQGRCNVSTQPQRRVTPAKARRDAKKLNRQKALARRAAAKRRRQYAITGMAALAAIVLIGGAAWAFRGGKSAQPTASASTGCASASVAPSASAAASASATPTGSFPSLPPGADPALATKPVVAPPSGNPTALKVTTLIAGKGAATTTGQSVTVNYVGVSYQTCQEFDSSWKASQPFTLTLGAGGVIKGWDQGLVGVKVGSRVQLDIPASLGYGEGTGETNGPLRFVVDVLSAK
jgi:peptidylprolyl isomerase